MSKHASPVQQSVDPKAWKADPKSASPPAPQAAADSDGFMPPEPRTLAETGLNHADIEALVLKSLLNQGVLSGRKIAEQLKIPFNVAAECLQSQKQQMLVRYKAAAAAGDYEHDLTEQGVEKARRWAQRCTFSGAAPVPLKDYVEAMRRQSIRDVKFRMPDVRAAFADMSVSDDVLGQLGQALMAGRGVFLYGPPGNGKTTVAERLVDSLKQTIWIPRTLTVGGEIIRLFDPSVHHEAPLAAGEGLLKSHGWDRRWVRIRRPTLVVGGELTMSQLDFNADRQTGIIESPLQLKSNGGALVVDDFGRQKFPVEDLLNRWIVPLEKRYDYQNLPSGRQIQVPFDQMLVFATNLAPKDLVDEAFLRRMPYKIEMGDPSETQFRDLTKTLCGKMNIKHDEGAVTRMLEKHYRHFQRPLRFCHARDLLSHVKIFCEFHELPLALNDESFDAAARNYFAGL